VTSAQQLSSQLDAGIEMLSAGPTLEVLLTEVRRRCGTDQTVLINHLSSYRLPVDFAHLAQAIEIVFGWSVRWI
jgi:hypothetical protein